MTGSSHAALRLKHTVEALVPSTVVDFFGVVNKNISTHHIVMTFALGKSRSRRVIHVGIEEQKSTICDICLYYIPVVYSIPDYDSPFLELTASLHLKMEPVGRRFTFLFGAFRRNLAGVNC